VRYLLDTNVISEPARPAPDPRVDSWLGGLSALQLAISVVTLGEIRKGVELLVSGAKRMKLEQWLETELPRQFRGRLLAVDDAVAHEWGRLTAAGRRTGRDLPVVDGLLLATAAVHKLVLATRNESDCAGRGVPVYNPWTDTLHS
jgi:predicted nucleic acid-binding protein